MFSKNKKLIVIVVLSTTLGLGIFLLKSQTTKKVLGTVVEPSPILIATPLAISPSPIFSPGPEKSVYTVAVFGDSMVDTMGENLEYLQKSLASEYPDTKFNLYNYGIGGQNIGQGLGRFHQPFTNRERHYSAISDVGADIIILGTFAYNPFSPHDRDKHWLTMKNLIEEAKKTGADVYVLAEIAPLKAGFGKGPHGINWPENLASEQAAHIVEQLENGVGLAESLAVPLIDAYSLSQVNGNYGNPAYVNGDDGIHPSVEGHVLTANLIARTIKL